LFGERPFNFKKFKVAALNEYEVTLPEPSKMVMVGDSLTTDIMFGNLNKMTTIWVNKYREACESMKLYNLDLYELEQE